MTTYFRKTTVRSFPLIAALLYLFWVSAFPFPATAASPQAWPHEHSDLAPDPAVRFGHLPNGFRYILMENQTPRNRVSMHLMVQAGSLNETESEKGMAHFLEHMAFCGSTHFPPGEIVKYFQSIGMDFGPDANARTGFEETVYDLNLPSGDPQSLRDALRVMHDFAAGALLLPEEVERERQVILAEKRTRDSSSYRTLQKTLAFEFPEALVSSRLPIGETDTLVRMTAEDLRKFYRTWYRPDNTILVMVGSFDLNAAESLIAGQFSRWTVEGPVPDPPDLGSVNHQGVKPFAHYEAESGKTTVSIGIVEGIDPLPDTRGQRARRLLESLADRIVQNRLDALMGKDQTPFTSAFIGSGTFLKEFRYAEIQANTRPENWEAGLSLIERQLRGALENGFSESEVDRVRREYQAVLDNLVRQAGTRDSTDIARTILARIGDDQVFQSPEQDRELLAPVLDNMTARDLHEALVRVWSPEHRLVQVTGNADLRGDPVVSPESRILAAYEGSRNFSAVGLPDETKVSFPYLPVPVDTGIIAMHDEIPDLGILRIWFENQVRLHLKPTDFRQNQVLVEVAFGPGSSGEPDGKPGISRLAEDIVNESGVGGLTRDELERSLAGTSTRLAFSISPDRFFFQGESTPSELELLFQLIHARMADPAFREEAHRFALERYRQQYRQYVRSVDGMARIHLSRFLAGGDLRFGLPTDSEMASLTLEDVTTWILPQWKEAPLEISLVGDFDVDTVLRLASRYVGTLSPRRTGKPIETRKGPVFPVGERKDIPVETAIDKTLVVTAFATEDFWNIHRTRRLSILGDLFSERLRERVREKLGAAYSPAAFNHPSRAYSGYGVFQALVHVNPTDAEKIVGEIRAIASGLAHSHAAADEVKRVIDPALTRIRDLVRTNEYWLNSVLSGSARHPAQLEWSRTILSDYASITPADLHRLARTYFQPGKEAVLIVHPASFSGQP